MLSTFRIAAILEGISYLLIFGLTMPLKYWAEMPQPNKWVGYAHGFLFIAYVILAIVFWMEKKWSIKRLIVLIVASLLPFGTFYIDKKYLKPLA